jgi:hypothetical protein
MHAQRQVQDTILPARGECKRTDHGNSRGIDTESLTRAGGTRRQVEAQEGEHGGRGTSSGSSDSIVNRSYEGQVPAQYAKSLRAREVIIMKLE